MTKETEITIDHSRTLDACRRLSTALQNAGIELGFALNDPSVSRNDVLITLHNGLKPILGLMPEAADQADQVDSPPEPV